MKAKTRIRMPPIKATDEKGANERCKGIFPYKFEVAGKQKHCPP
jgi:hypothetical protein